MAKPDGDICFTIPFPLMVFLVFSLSWAVAMPDILFTPTNPISSCYHVEAGTLQGFAWLEKYCISRMAYSQRDIRQLTARLDAMGLTYEVKWAFARTGIAKMEMERDNEHA